MAPAVQVWVFGRVQGVSFRWYAAQKAVELELVGWVRNEPDGSVLCHFEGPADALEQMVQWCRVGSPSADIHHLDVRDVESSGASTFSVEC